jgi:hypothetical protein
MLVAVETDGVLCPLAAVRNTGIAYLFVLATHESPLLDFAVHRLVALDARPFGAQHMFAVRTDGVALTVLVIAGVVVVVRAIFSGMVSTTHSADSASYKSVAIDILVVAGGHGHGALADGRGTHRHRARHFDLSVIAD